MSEYSKFKNQADYHADTSYNREMAAQVYAELAIAAAQAQSAKVAALTFFAQGGNEYISENRQADAIARLAEIAFDI